MNTPAVTTTATWMGYTIKRKEDWGRFDKERDGWVVVQRGCNVMPAAIWFKSIPDACKGIACLELAKRIAPREPDGCDSDIFWALIELTRIGDAP